MSRLIQTEQHYKCGSCGYEGPVNAIQYQERDEFWGQIAYITVTEDHQCPECGSYEVEEE